MDDKTKDTDPFVSRPFRCDADGCTLSFESSKELRMHVAQHRWGPHSVITNPTTGEISFKCLHPYCNKIVSDRKVLRKHLLTHRPRQFQCHFEACGKRFYERAKLKRHFLVHTGEKNFVCTFEGCGKSFAYKANLKTHIRTHTGQRPFACTFPGCNKRFAQASNRNSHVLTHTRKKHRNAIDGVAPEPKEHLPNTKRKLHRTQTASSASSTGSTAGEGKDEEAQKLAVAASMVAVHLQAIPPSATTTFRETKEEDGFVNNQNVPPTSTSLSRFTSPPTVTSAPNFTAKNSASIVDDETKDLVISPKRRETINSLLCLSKGMVSKSTLESAVRAASMNPGQPPMNWPTRPETGEEKLDDTATAGSPSTTASESTNGGASPKVELPESATWNPSTSSAPLLNHPHKTGYFVTHSNTAHAPDNDNNRNLTMPPSAQRTSPSNVYAQHQLAPQQHGSNLPPLRHITSTSHAPDAVVSHPLNAVVSHPTSSQPNMTHHQPQYCTTAGSPQNGMFFSPNMVSYQPTYYATQVQQQNLVPLRYILPGVGGNSAPYPPSQHAVALGPPTNTPELPTASTPGSQPAIYHR